ncbi:uncharacterized protein HD556DRAFT_1444586 [Suillus plorans]|uniref:RING-type domain-containing protein n=1 Tax=Suillus plorans TaxID=116603 RepID=A0A9P7AM79_9AGAM|nr:uncharacterized protein HD556DRAFT_1444586 [Suillus plorans]KAG1792323.1 hypothetical protein HD556DRAFT_1444586 [Suillus plorans]
MSSESRSELIARFPIVRYVPIPDTGYYDLTSFPERLGESPVQNVYLEAHNARCDICLVDFDPPPSKILHTVAEIESDPLIQLPCSHVFHKSCIGNWLLGTSQSTCPSCRANVIQMERSGIRNHGNRSVPISKRPETSIEQSMRELSPSPSLTSHNSPSHVSERPGIPMEQSMGRLSPSPSMTIHNSHSRVLTRSQTPMEQSMGRLSPSPSRTIHNSQSQDSLPFPPVCPSASSQNSLRPTRRRPKRQFLANGEAITFKLFRVASTS